ncbi:pantoate--beta-alanine ligase [Oceanicella actignis]|uniref:Pantothenate synthetase n=1 Tax=Oceanicella actignis TaxID=1189325 RepID=A0A1M7TUK5_9RHOB|nr:pantoate--beta-alanine ligase [Oceanicella actignis]SES78737.1 pantothenate synthetase [Oceanicella actignis]SHN74395.1 pantoate--beta-alanine ligase [Oceanicella actignis]
MQICRTKQEIRALTRRWRAEGRSIGFAPTMGYLHEGHLALVRRARAENDAVVVSIFVNPTQFGPNEDFDSYPRDPERDLLLLRAEGADAVFLPDAAEMYAPHAQTFVEAERLSRILIGRLRPGHFRGVATVVTKLFNIVAPDAAYFGEKDYQQLTVIRRMVADLDVPVRIVGVPTVREPDGLAMSSRNVRLSPEDRAAAPVLCRALDAAEARAARGPVSVEALRRLIRETLEASPRGRDPRVDVRAADDLSPLRGALRRPAVALISMRFGDVLLIDQRVIRPADQENAP